MGELKILPLEGGGPRERWREWFYRSEDRFIVYQLKIRLALFVYPMRKLNIPKTW